MNKFDQVQAAAQARSTTTMNSKTLAQQIVAAAQGDARLAYDFMDMLNAPRYAHVAGEEMMGKPLPPWIKINKGDRRPTERVLVSYEWTEPCFENGGDTTYLGRHWRMVEPEAAALGCRSWQANRERHALDANAGRRAMTRWGEIKWIKRSSENGARCWCAGSSRPASTCCFARSWSSSSRTLSCERLSSD
jgi:hypothetical protein